MEGAFTGTGCSAWWGAVRVPRVPPRVDAQRPERGSAAGQAQEQEASFEQERSQVAPEQNPQGDSRVRRRAELGAAVGGGSGGQGRHGRDYRVYPPEMTRFWTGAAMNNLT